MGGRVTVGSGDPFSFSFCEKHKDRVYGNEIVAFKQRMNVGIAFYVFYALIYANFHVLKIIVLCQNDCHHVWWQMYVREGYVMLK